MLTTAKSPKPPKSLSDEAVKTSENLLLDQQNSINSLGLDIPKSLDE